MKNRWIGGLVIAIAVALGACAPPNQGGQESGGASQPPESMGAESMEPAESMGAESMEPAESMAPSGTPAPVETPYDY
jgi:hypothetical protein